jgi:competence protein ComEC
VLIDAGPASRDFDAGQRRILPFLRERRVRALEFIVLTHPHLDHIGGAVALLDALHVGYLIEPGHSTDASQPYLDVLEAADGSETAWRPARSGRSLTLDGVRFDFLWPDSQTVDAVEDPNQISAVLRVSFGEFSLLLTGDAGAEVEAILLARHGSALESDVLKLGHHGSTTSSSDAFLDAVKPALAVVSAGRRNGYGHPSPAILTAVAARDIDLARTDQDGTVTLKVARGGDRWARMEW